MKKNEPRVYLAGGFRSGWQAIVKAAVPGVRWLDPSIHHIKDPKKYTQWDLRAIRSSDLVLANMEPSNPGGYALALEVGFAKALGKAILLIDQHEERERRRYFEMVRQVADRRFDTLQAAIVYLGRRLHRNRQ